MKNFLKNFIEIMAVLAIFSTVCFTSNTNESIVVNAKSQNKQVKHHKSKKRVINHKRHKRHLSYSKQMRNDTNNYNKVMTNDEIITSYLLGEDSIGITTYTKDYSGMVSSIGQLISDTDTSSNKNDVLQKRNDAVSIYRIFNKRFSKKENNKLNNMRRKVGINITNNNYRNIKNSVSTFLQETSNSISSLEK